MAYCFNDNKSKYELSEMFKTVAGTFDSKSVPANGYTSISTNMSSVIPSGYKPVFARLNATGSNAVLYYQLSFNIETYNAFIGLRNVTNSAVSVSPSLSITCIKE